MYSTILGSFLNSLNALRSYVDCMNDAIKKKEEGTFERRESASYILAMLLRDCILTKEKGEVSYLDKVSDLFEPGL